MVRKSPTSRWRGTDMFSRRIVITIPRSGVLLIALSVGISLTIPASLGKIMSAIGIILSVIAIASIAEARHQLRNFRFEIEERATAQIESLVIPVDPDLRASVEEAFEGVENVVKTRFVRLSKRPHSS